MSSTTIQSETTRINYVEYAGDTLSMLFQVRSDSETGPLMELADFTITMQVKRLLPSGEPEATALLNFSSTDGTITRTATDNIICTISAGQTSELGIGEFGYAIVLTHNLTEYVNTIIRGKIILKSR